MRTLLLASGSGTLTQAVINAAGPYEVIAVGSDTPNAPVLNRARAHGIPDFHVDFTRFTNRAEWNRELASTVKEYAPDWIVSAGFMRILGTDFLTQFQGRIINTHPALLPSFPGAHAVKDALNYGAKITGTTIHLIDDGVDTGPIIRQFPVPIRHNDTEDTLHERIKKVERTELVRLLTDLTTHTLAVTGRHVTLVPNNPTRK